MFFAQLKFMSLSTNASNFTLEQYQEQAQKALDSYQPNLAIKFLKRAFELNVSSTDTSSISQGSNQPTTLPCSAIPADHKNHQQHSITAQEIAHQIGTCYLDISSNDLSNDSKIDSINEASRWFLCSIESKFTGSWRGTSSS